jgi:hypothetical protein
MPSEAPLSDMAFPFRWHDFITTRSPFINKSQQSA